MRIDAIGMTRRDSQAAREHCAGRVTGL